MARGSYVYSVTVDGVVRYIGKGTGRRHRRHVEIANRNNRLRAEGHKVKATKWHNRLAKAIAGGAIVAVEIVADGMSSEEALTREIAEIASRRDHLWNYTNGGEGVDSESAKRLWADPQHREAMVAKRRTDDYRAQARVKAIRQHAEPAAREALSKRSRALWQDEDFRAKATEASRRRWGSEEFRERHSAAVRQGWEQNPDRRARRGEITASYAGTPEFRQQASEQTKALWSDPDYRARCTAQWDDPEKRAARAAKLTPEFLKRRGEAIRQGMARKRALRAGGEDRSG